MIIAQISDLHVASPGQLAYGRIDAAACVARCVKHLSQMRPRPEAVVASGDLVNSGEPAEYRRLREVLAPLPMPVYLMPGNHDDRTALAAEFGDHGYLESTHGTLHYAVECGPLRLIMLDSVQPGSDGGVLGANQLEWLANTLSSAPGNPTLIFMHHPPVATGIHYMDRIALATEDAVRLREIVAGHPQIERIACGHLHRAVDAHWGGTTVGVCPSAAFQSIPGLAGDRFAPADNEPPAYQLHYWIQNHLVTHTLQVTA